ncbi:nucleolar pre-ribosomal-associated protein 1-like isoform X2 [Hirundo rustica]|uniref:nucleolar pre-ribosomal-associated protein 1-like isoform X2 n=1 Tax=Hirundo rustica TaxID=43150 RepID=UPI001A952A9F|nr:nucleolar pre-ribosomal-associated protein 1-like isoform X2 [Hirundo rustica]
MRAAAYFVLASFRGHLEGARFRERSQLLYLLDAVQNGIRQPNLRFTFSLTLYVARVAQQILKPEEHMYIKVNRFLLSHQYLDLRKVPGFFQLFYSFDFEYKTEREWILRFLGEGLRDKHCYELYDYQRIFQVVLSFFNSPLCDEGSQIGCWQQRSWKMTAVATEGLDIMGSESKASVLSAPLRNPKGESCWEKKAAELPTTGCKCK